MGELPDDWNTIVTGYGQRSELDRQGRTERNTRTLSGHSGSLQTLLSSNFVTVNGQCELQAIKASSAAASDFDLCSNLQI